MVYHLYYSSKTKALHTELFETELKHDLISGGGDEGKIILDVHQLCIQLNVYICLKASTRQTKSVFVCWNLLRVLNGAEDKHVG